MHRILHSSAFLYVLLDMLTTTAGIAWQNARMTLRVMVIRMQMDINYVFINVKVEGFLIMTLTYVIQSALLYLISMGTHILVDASISVPKEHMHRILLGSVFLLVH